jgi:hypothetical protein
VRIRKFALCVPIGIAVALLAAGCGMFGGNQPEQQPAAVETPRFVNDLSQLSTQPVPALSHPAEAFRVAAPGQKNPDAQNRAYLESLGTTKYVGTEENPGTEKLLNPKAAQFAPFSDDLANHLFAELRQREMDDQIARVKLPDDLKPVVITAILDKQGKLTELVLEQHSGKSLVDQLFINACKKSLWAKNPPPQALSESGDYRVRVEGKLITWASIGDGRWRYKTWVGIGLL